MSKDNKIKELENKIKKLERDRHESSQKAEREHQKRLLCLRKLLVEELKQS